ncbi:endonuclease 8-like 3 [Paramuricea clavata]|uniref:Endonuclease 8-like 3 n=1 Tax=Paramuricea clavata TaxID=317549 RepID=A0A6S7GWI2_PARCT|nr:endonuclease 8-like 3 [Paramuricea clavata]
MSMWRANGPIHPVCDTHQRLARMKVVKDVSKPNFGRPFFVCCDRENPCEFWQWGDRQEFPKPKCGHGLNACVRKVKKEGENQGRLFFCCPNDREKSCGFFEWKLDLENPFNQVHFPHVERVGILQSNPALYTYMVAETGLTFTSARENPHDAYAEYIGELPIFSLTKDMEKLSLIDY